MKRLLIAGSTGFLGSQIVEHLSRRQACFFFNLPIMKNYTHLLILLLSGMFMVPTIAQINCDLTVEDYPWLEDI